MISRVRIEWLYVAERIGCADSVHDIRGTDHQGLSTPRISLVLKRN